jgi:hypothetical protein
VRTEGGEEIEGRIFVLKAHSYKLEN